MKDWLGNWVNTYKKEAFSVDNERENCPDPEGPQITWLSPLSVNQ